MKAESLKQRWRERKKRIRPVTMIAGGFSS